MKQVYILVEGGADAEFLQRLLPPEVLKDAEIVIAGGSSGIPSLARSLLVRRKKPVAVVMDADSIDSDLIDERQTSTEDLIRAADASIPVKVIVAVPEIEAWFFAAPETIERVLGESVPPEFIALGKRDPRGVLLQLAEKSKTNWDSRRAVGLLDDHDIERIRALPEVSELSSFLRKVQTEDKAA
jgi:hypothetical protein